MGIWDRVDHELTRRKKDWPWLYDKLGYTKQRAHNWKTRDIPADQWLAVADAFEESLDWIVGRAPARWREEGAPPEPDLPLAGLLPSERDLVYACRHELKALGLPADMPWYRESILLAAEMQLISSPKERRAAYSAALAAIVEKDHDDPADPPADDPAPASAPAVKRPSRKRASNP